MQLRRKSPEKASRRGNPEGLASQRWEGASHTETCSIKKMGTAHHAEGQVVNEGQGGWSMNRGGQRRRKKEQWSDLRPLTMLRHLDFILSALRSHWGWRWFSLLVLRCESILFDWYLNKVILAVLSYLTGGFMKLLLDIWSVWLLFTFLKCGFCLFTKPWSCVDCTSVTICFLNLRISWFKLQTHGYIRNHSPKNRVSIGRLGGTSRKTHQLS